jgi:hypothetical protein
MKYTSSSNPKIHLKGEIVFNSNKVKKEALSQEKVDASIKRLERFSQITDSSIGLPFTKFNIGIDAIIGLVPVVGDTIGFLLSCYVLFEAQRMGVSKRVKLKILVNMFIDFFGGLIPLFGDLFDAFFKANTRNTAILKEELFKKGKLNKAS